MVGRRDAADRLSLGDDDLPLLLDDGFVSHRHATIRAIDGGFTITDDNSRDGTHVNDAVISTSTPIRDGDRLRFGDTVLAARIETTAEVQTPAAEDDTLNALKAAARPFAAPVVDPNKTRIEAAPVPPRPAQRAAVPTPARTAPVAPVPAEPKPTPKAPVRPAARAEVRPAPLSAITPAPTPMPSSPMTPIPVGPKPPSASVASVDEQPAPHEAPPAPRKPLRLAPAPAAPRATPGSQWRLPNLVRGADEMAASLRQFDLELATAIQMFEQDGGGTAVQEILALTQRVHDNSATTDELSTLLAWLPKIGRLLETELILVNLVSGRGSDAAR